MPDADRSPAGGQARSAAGGVLAALERMTGDTAPSEPPDALEAYLREVADAADLLSALDLDAIVPEVGFDPGWPEEEA